MSFFKPVYFCSSCRSIVESVDDLYFVEEVSKRGFCGEECIEKFYAPIFKHFESLEMSLRGQYKLKNENMNHLIQDVHIMERVLKEPDEIYCLETELEEEFFSFHLEVGSDKSETPGWVIVVCLVYDGRPSFILLVTATANEQLKNEFCFGDKIEDIPGFLSDNILEMDLPFEIEEVEQGGGPQNMEKIEVAPETLEMVEQKKSAMLATLLEKRSEADIPYENFHLYDQFTPSTLESPDEVYKHYDDLGDEILTYVKAHDKQGVSFFYFVLCLNLGEDYTEAGKALLPILTFPSLDGELSDIYRNGEKVAGKLKN